VSEGVLVAVIAAVPPTLAAFVAAYQVRKLSRPLNEVNAAVNHRTPGQRRLVEMVDEIHGEVHSVAEEVARVRQELEQHRAWHSIEEDDNREDPCA
jgi:hypothetical protein